MISRRTLLGTFIGTVASWPFAALLKPRYKFQTYVVTEFDEIIYSPIPKYDLTRTDFNVCIDFNVSSIDNFRYRRRLKCFGICHGETVVTKRDLGIVLDEGSSLKMSQKFSIEAVPEYMLEHYLAKLKPENRHISNVDNIDGPIITKDIYEALCQELGQRILT